MLRILFCCFALILCSCVARPPSVFAPEDTTQLLEAKNGHHQVWSHLDFPIGVVVDNAMEPGYQEATEEAVASWNHVLGHDALFVQEYTGYRPLLDDPLLRTISVREAEQGVSEQKVRLYGSALNTYASRGRIVRSRISLDPGIPPEAQIPVLIHELGHALGLRHDEESPFSIMFPGIHDHFCQTIQPEDVEAVRQQMLL